MNVIHGQALFNDEKYAEAIHELKDLVKIDKRDVEAVATLGAAYYHSGDFKKAEKYLKKALYINEQHCFSLYYLGLTCDARGDGLCSLVYLEQAIRFCSNDSELRERAHMKREILRQKYKEKPIAFRYPRLTSYGSECMFMLSVTALLLMVYVKMQQEWLIMASLGWIASYLILIFIRSRTSGIKVYDDKIVLSHGLLWTSNTPIKFIQVHPPEEIQNPWDKITGNTKICMNLTQESSLPDRKGKFLKKDAIIIPSIGNRQFMHYLWRHIERRATGGNIPIRSEMPDPYMTY